MARLTITLALAFLSMLPKPVAANDVDLNFFRFNEDHSHLVQKSNPSSYERLKHLPLSNESYASFGGQYRAQFSHFDGARFGLTPPDDGNVLLHRFLIHSDFHFTNNFRTFLEVGSYHTDTNRLSPGPFDEGDAHLQQAFVDIKHDDFLLRLGRQEAAFGSARLIGVRDGPNIRRSFDGAKIVGEFDNVKAQVFAYQEAETNNDNFLGSSNENEELWGVYTTWSDIASTPTNADIYYIRTHRGIEQYTQGVGDDKRHMLGTRIFGAYQNWDWNHELMHQFGEFQNVDINAWSVATITGYTFQNKPWSPRISLSANIASGDKDPNDTRLNTFNPLYPNLYYFEEATLLAPQNFFNVEPEITIKPRDDLSISLDWNFFWKHKKNDGVYTAGLFPLPNTENSDSRFVAHVPSLSIDWQVNKHILFDVSYSHFFAGDVIKDAGGTDVDFVRAEFTFTF